MKRLILLALSAALLASCGPDTPPASFTLKLNPQSLTVATNATGNVTATISSTNGYTQSVTYSATPDAGLSVTQSGNVFTVSGAGSTTGTHTLTIKATGADGQTQSGTVSVTISEASTSPTFSLDLSPSTQTLAAGVNGTVTATITPAHGYNQNVTYSASSDAGLSVTQNANVFTVSSTTPGSHTLTVTATGADGQVKTSSAQIVVQGSAGVFIPAVGAPVGSGDGTKTGTVYVSPNQQEVELLQLVNEVRTKGTINGVNVTAGSCVASFTPLNPLRYDGLLAFAARKHAEYEVNVGDEGHIETFTNSPYFYGTNPSNRAQRAYLQLAGLTVTGAGEVSGSYASAADMVRGWVDDEPHCKILMDPLNTVMGSGYTSSGQAKPFMNSNNLNIYPNNWVLDLY